MRTRACRVREGKEDRLCYASCGASHIQAISESRTVTPRGMRPEKSGGGVWGRIFPHLSHWVSGLLSMKILEVFFLITVPLSHKYPCVVVVGRSSLA
jgi:hypothetical protein